MQPAIMVKLPNTTKLAFTRRPPITPIRPRATPLTQERTRKKPERLTPRNTDRNKDWQRTPPGLVSAGAALRMLRGTRLDRPPWRSRLFFFQSLSLNSFSVIAVSDATSRTPH